MSNVYVIEPPTKGKVVLSTSVGDLDIELWAKEAPKACRNFVQLCLDGYYDNTIFHRLIPGFMVQGGDRTGTGTGGESIYGEPYPDELHSRLRFSHRGIVACANDGTPNANKSQFFITFDKTDWLDKKHTIFGKVVGDTIYNALRLGEGDTDASDRPLEPHRVLSAEVLWNPFDDVVPRDRSELPWAPREEAAEVQPVQKKKKKKELHLLSFGEEAQEEEREAGSGGPRKIKSSHDVLTDDPRLIRGGTPMDQGATAEELRKREALRASVRRAGDKSGAAAGSGVGSSQRGVASAYGDGGRDGGGFAGGSRTNDNASNRMDDHTSNRGAAAVGPGPGRGASGDGVGEVRDGGGGGTGRDGGGFGADAGGDDDMAADVGDEDGDARDFDAVMRARVLERQRQLMGGAKAPRDPGGSGGRAAAEAGRAKDRGGDARDASAGGVKGRSSSLAAAPKAGMEDAGGSGKGTSQDRLRDGDKYGSDKSEGSDEEDDDAAGGKDRPKAAPLRLKKVGGAASRPRLGLGAAAAAAQDNVLSVTERQRLAHRDKKRSIADRQKATMERLAKFQQGLKQVHVAAPAGDAAKGSGGGTSDGDDDEGDWRAHALKFAPDASNKDSMARKEDVDDYVVHDPLLEKGKEKFNMQEAKRKRRNREWATGAGPKG